MKEQAEKHIIKNYGENWLKTDWDTGDVIDIMIEFAKEKAWEVWKKKSYYEYVSDDLEKKYEKKSFEDWWEQEEKDG